MAQVIAGYYDGRVIIPEGAVDLPVGQPLEIRVEVAADRPRFASLLSFAADLPDAPPDLAARHDDYAGGRP